MFSILYLHSTERRKPVNYCTRTLLYTLADVKNVFNTLPTQFSTAQKPHVVYNESGRHCSAAAKHENPEDQLTMHWQIWSNGPSLH
jgi:hypothetical protein